MANALLSKECERCGATFAVRDRYDLRRRRFCGKACGYAGRTVVGAFQPGHAPLYRNPGHSDATKAKMALINRANVKRGEDHPNWRGGVRKQRSNEMLRWEYKEWRTAVFVRDDYTCQDCGARGVYLHADHIASWAEHRDLRYEVSNGRTLCYRCHFTKTFGRDDPEAALRWGVPVKYRTEQVAL